MLRQILILKDNRIIYRSEFGKGLSEESFTHVMKQIVKTIQANPKEEIHHVDYFGMRISMIVDQKYSLLSLMVTDLADDQVNVQKQLIKLRKEFMGMFEPILNDAVDESMFKMFDDFAESVHKNLRAKISLIGFSGVGKTTILNLIQAKELPTEHIPTVTGDIGLIKIGKLFFNLWDFAGQEQFSFLWNKFIEGSDAVLLITDSTVENVDKSKFFTELIEKEAPNAKSCVIANKQDLPGALPSEDIERMLSMKTYPMVAIDPNNHNKMISIIADILELSTEVANSLQGLIDRDKKAKEAEKSIQNGDFNTALKLLEECAQISLACSDEKGYRQVKEQITSVENIMRNQGGVQAPASPAAINIPPPPGGVSGPTIPPLPAGISDQATPDPQTMIKDLKLKAANINNMIFDLEMSSIQGGPGGEESKAKIARLTELKIKIEDQIKSLGG